MNRASRLATMGFVFGFGCGGAHGTLPDAASAGDGGGDIARDRAADLPSTQPTDAGTPSCVPTIPTVAWTSPYAGWARGIPTDPTFFPLSIWLQGAWHATEMAQLGVNIYVGNNAGTDQLAASDLTILKNLGMYAIVGQDSVGLANIDDPTIVGWWMTPDEPDNAQDNGAGGYGPPVAPAKLVTQYNAYKAADATRPIYLGLGQGVAFDGWEGRGSNVPPESDYVPAADIVDFDIYPYNNCGGDTNEQMTCGQFWLNAFGVDRLHQWSTRNQAVWTDIETTIISAGTTIGPTPAQTKSEVWLALIHGANGITYFLDTWNPSFREDGIFANSAMVTAVTALNAQIASLAPLLNSGSIPGLVTVGSSNVAVPVDMMVKANGQTLTVFAAAARAGTTRASFTVKSLPADGSVNVVGESRTIDLVAGKFADDFAANAVHVYQLSLSTVTCN